MWKYTCNSGTGKRKIGRTFISLLKIFSIFTLFCGNSFRLGFIVKYFYLFFYALYRFTCSFICFFPPSKIRVVPEAVGTPPSATNRLAGLRAFFCVCVCVGHCWLLWVILMKKNKLVCSYELYVPSLPAAVRDGMMQHAVKLFCIKHASERVCVCDHW